VELMYRLGYAQLMQGQELGRHYILQAVNTALQAELGAIAILGVVQELSMYLFAGEQELFDARAAWFREEVLARTRRDVAGFFVDRILAEAAFKKGDYQRAYELAQGSIEWYRSTKNCWHELSLMQIIEKSAPRLGLEQPAQQPLITETLNKIANSLNNAPLQAEWQVFVQNMNT